MPRRVRLGRIQRLTGWRGHEKAEEHKLHRCVISYWCAAPATVDIPNLESCSAAAAVSGHIMLPVESLVDCKEHYIAVKGQRFFKTQLATEIWSTA